MSEVSVRCIVCPRTDDHGHTVAEIRASATAPDWDTGCIHPDVSWSSIDGAWYCRRCWVGDLRVTAPTGAGGETP